LLIGLPQLHAFKNCLKQLNIKIPIETLFAEKGLKLDQEKMTVTKLERMDVNAIMFTSMASCLFQQQARNINMLCRRRNRADIIAESDSKQENLKLLMPLNLKSFSRMQL
jgi:hypothetical protein